MSDKSRALARWRSTAADWLRRLLARLPVRADARSRTRRARSLAILLALGFALVGVMRELPLLSFVFQQPFDIDWALRTMALGWYEPRNVLPVTVVDIDEATYQGWHSPAITPRAELAKLIEVVTRAEPSAVVVDIDLSGRAGDASADDEQRLATMLAAYRDAAPLIFPKRTEPGAGNARQAAASVYDSLFRRNPKLQWAHATFVTDGDGAVRQWEDWLAVCSNGTSVWLPAVSVRVVTALADAGADVKRTVAPSEPAACANRAAVNERRLLVGPRITGTSASPFARDARAVSAQMLLDPAIDRDDQRLFNGRVVLIGATHSGSGDVWLTPGGLVPGVELLANTVHYEPLAVSDGPGSEIAYRALAILLFLLFVGVTLPLRGWQLRGIAAFAAGVVLALVIVAIVIGGWGYLRIFESLESAIWLSVLYFAAQAMIELVVDVVWHSRSFAPGTNRKERFWSTLRAACLVEDE